MTKRLTELQRQRALLQEHLSWLDQEIAKEQSSAPSDPFTPQTTAAPQPPEPRPQPARSQNTPPPLPCAKSVGSSSGLDSSTGAPVNAAAADDIIKRYRSDLTALGQDTRKGCLLTATVVGGLLILGALLAYALYAHHIGRWW